MPLKTTEPWFQLCNLAAIEEDPVKLLMLVQEICRLLKEKGVTRPIFCTKWSVSVTPC